MKRSLLALLIACLGITAAFAQPTPQDPDLPIALEAGTETFSGVLEGDDMFNSYALPLEAGQSIIFFMDMSGPGYAFSDLYDPAGEWLGGGGSFVYNDPLGGVILGPITAETGGEYLMEVERSDVNETVEYEFRVLYIELLPIEPDIPQTLEIAAGELAFFTFPVTYHERYDANVVSNGDVDTSLFFLTPPSSGRPAAQDGGRGTDPELENEIIRFEGHAALLVRGESGAGTVEVNLISDPVPPLTEEPQVIQLYQNYFPNFSLYMEEGQLYVINLEAIEPGAGQPHMLVMWEGFPLFTSRTTDGTNISMSIVAPFTGLYLVEFVDNFTVNDAHIAYQVSGYEAFAG